MLRVLKCVLYTPKCPWLLLYASVNVLKPSLFYYTIGARYGADMGRYARIGADMGEHGLYMRVFVPGRVFFEISDPPEAI